MMQWQKATFAKGALQDKYAYMYGREFWIRAIPPERVLSFNAGDVKDAVYTNLLMDGVTIIFHNCVIERLPEFTDNPPLIPADEFAK